MLNQSKLLVRELIDAINQQDRARIDTIATAPVAGEIKGSLDWIASTWTDHHLEITEMVAEDDKVWCKLDSRGGHKGEWMGIAPTGRHWTNTGVGFIQVQDEKIVRVEWFFDVLNHITQLGATIKP